MNQRMHPIPIIVFELTYAGKSVLNILKNNIIDR